MADKDEKDYEIGYGKPPVSGRWRAGQSGNSKGRKKGSKSEKSILRALMEERLPGANKYTTREVLLKTLLQMALKERDLRAMKLLIELDIKYSPEAYKFGSQEAMQKRNEELERQLEEERQKSRGGVLVVPAGVSLEEFIKEAEEQRQVMLAHQERNARRIDNENI